MGSVDLLPDREARPTKCMQCQAELVSPIVCDGCHTLYPASMARDHFELLGLPQRYAIDEARLNAAYRALARSVHPDRFAADGTDALALAVRLSAALNQAYDVLRDPVRRADYLLELSGGPSATQVRDVPGALLGEVMTLREEIEAAKATCDAFTVDRLRGSLTERRGRTLNQIREIAATLPETEENTRRELRKLLNSMKYFSNLLTELAADPLAGTESSRND